MMMMKKIILIVSILTVSHVHGAIDGLARGQQRTLNGEAEVFSPYKKLRSYTPNAVVVPPPFDHDPVRLEYGKGEGKGTKKRKTAKRGKKKKGDKKDKGGCNHGHGSETDPGATYPFVPSLTPIPYHHGYIPGEQDSSWPVGSPTTSSVPMPTPVIPVVGEGASQPGPTISAGRPSQLGLPTTGGDESSHPEPSSAGYQPGATNSEGSEPSQPGPTGGSYGASQPVTTMSGGGDVSSQPGPTPSADGDGTSQPGITSGGDGASQPGPTTGDGGDGSQLPGPTSSGENTSQPGPTTSDGNASSQPASTDGGGENLAPYAPSWPAWTPAWSPVLPSASPVMDSKPSEPNDSGTDNEPNQNDQATANGVDPEPTATPGGGLSPTPGDDSAQPEPTTVSDPSVTPQGGDSSTQADPTPGSNPWPTAEELESTPPEPSGGNDSSPTPGGGDTNPAESTPGSSPWPTSEEGESTSPESSGGNNLWPTPGGGDLSQAEPTPPAPTTSSPGFSPSPVGGDTNEAEPTAVIEQEVSSGQETGTLSSCSNKPAESNGDLVRSIAFEYVLLVVLETPDDYIESVVHKVEDHLHQAIVTELLECSIAEGQVDIDFLSVASLPLDKVLASGSCTEDETMSNTDCYVIFAEFSVEYITSGSFEDLRAGLARLMTELMPPSVRRQLASSLRVYDIDPLLEGLVFRRFVDDSNITTGVDSITGSQQQSNKSSSKPIRTATGVAIIGTAAALSIVVGLLVFRRRRNRGGNDADDSATIGISPRPDVGRTTALTYNTKDDSMYGSSIYTSTGRDHSESGSKSSSSAAYDYSDFEAQRPLGIKEDTSYDSNELHDRQNYVYSGIEPAAPLARHGWTPNTLSI